MKLHLVAVGTKMPDWVQTGFEANICAVFQKICRSNWWKSPPENAVKMPTSKRILEKKVK